MLICIDKNFKCNNANENELSLVSIKLGGTSSKAITLPTVWNNFALLSGGLEDRAGGVF